MFSIHTLAFSRKIALNIKRRHQNQVENLQFRHYSCEHATFNAILLQNFRCKYMNKNDRNQSWWKSQLAASLGIDCASQWSTLPSRHSLVSDGIRLQLGAKSLHWAWLADEIDTYHV